MLAVVELDAVVWPRRDGCACDDNACSEPANGHWPWTRQHPAIRVADADVVLDTGDELWRVVLNQGIDHVYVAGVHTNLCVVSRSFGTGACPASLTTETIDLIEQHLCAVVPSTDVFP